ncbi:hypothetical protein CHUV0807_1347 [Cardiobacterium hominis]|uniref:Uncharacterized protein n=1 Tax=Cardiobacterium hominis TaxID=2718 RepID=A0A1C3H4R0_9GAMM|nr:hypothetical protein CHUV0807_1347 [Cardiobacterium hominis]
MRRGAPYGVVFIRVLCLKFYVDGYKTRNKKIMQRNGNLKRF